MVPAALAYLGLDPKSRDLSDLGKAFSALEKIRPYIRKFYSSQYINDLAAAPSRSLQPRAGESRRGARYYFAATGSSSAYISGSTVWRQVS